MKTLKIEESTAKKLYKTANAEFKTMLEETFGKPFFSQNIMDRIKTWDDVLNELGVDEEHIVPYARPKNKKQISQNAFAKIQAISEVLNEDWEANFNDSNEYKYYPWFEKIKSGWVFGYCGLCGGDSCLGAGYFFKSSELAIYVGKQFIDIYNEYLS